MRGVADDGFIKRKGAIHIARVWAGGDETCRLAILGARIFGYRQPGRTRQRCVDTSKSRRKKTAASNSWRSRRFERLTITINRFERFMPSQASGFAEFANARGTVIRKVQLPSCRRWPGTQGLSNKKRTGTCVPALKLTHRLSLSTIDASARPYDGSRDDRDRDNNIPASRRLWEVVRGRGVDGAGTRLEAAHSVSADEPRRALEVHRSRVAHARSRVSSPVR